MLASIGKLIWGGQQDSAVATLPSGQLYMRGEHGRQLKFKDAQAVIRRTSSPHQYQLEIARVYEEGEDTLQLEQGQDLEEDFVFLLDSALELRLEQHDSVALLVWNDVSGAPGDTLEFSIDSSVSVTAQNAFERSAWQCMYERRHNQPYTHATEADLAVFKYSPRKQTNTPDSASTGEKRSSEESESEQESELPSLLPPLRDAPVENSSPVCSSEAQLFLFNASCGIFQLQAKSVQAKIVTVAPFTYWLYVESDDRCWLRQPIEPGMNEAFNREHRSFIWCYYDDAGRVYSWSLRFTESNQEIEFREAFGRCAYETMNRASFDKIAKVDQLYLLDAYQEDADMADATLSGEEESDQEAELDEEEEEEEEEEATDEEDQEAASALGRNAKNSVLAVGYKHDRSFVVRGDKIGVFKYTDDDKLQFSAAINSVATKDGTMLNPHKVMLHEEDASMILLDPTRNDMLYKMDLEYGKVVDEWKVHDDIPCTTIAPSNKYAQLTQEKTFVGLSHNAMFRVDPRLQDQTKMVDSQLKMYATKNNFSCVASTEQGWYAVGNEKGEIRLFNKLGLNAKAVLPAIGDPISGIDVTADGRWLVATCPTYLLLVDCWNHEERMSGFVKGFSKERKPVPKRLQLKPEHVAYMGSSVSFTAARFNTGLNEHEKTIVTSTGPFVITWNFRRVKQGKLSDYQIREYGEQVVADNFKYGQDRNIVVALPDDVHMASKRSLATPNKAFQTRPGQSRSSVVNAPY